MMKFYETGLLNQGFLQEINEQCEFMKTLWVFGVDVLINGCLCVYLYFIKQETEDENLGDYYWKLPIPFTNNLYYPILISISK